MNMTLKKCISEPYKIGKKFSGSLQVTGELRGPMNVINPIIEIEFDNNSPFDYNYIDIPDFHRKYFIDSVKSIGGKIFEVTCRVDVLDTYSSQIKNSKGLIEKRSVGFNAYINDGTIFNESRNIYVTQHFKDDGNAYHADNNGYTCFDPNNWEFLIITGGPGASPSP